MTFRCLTCQRSISRADCIKQYLRASDRCTSAIVPPSIPVVRADSSSAPSRSVHSSAAEGEPTGRVSHRLAVDEATELSVETKQRMVAAEPTWGMSTVPKV